MTSPPRAPRPQRDDPCFLCNQPLGDPGKAVPIREDHGVRWAHQSCVDPAPLSVRLRQTGAYPPGYPGYPGQRLPRRFSAISWMGAVPGFLAQFPKEVPDQFWAVTAFDAKTQEPAIATVACMCGAEPEVEQMNVAVCHGERDGEKCGRAFILIHSRVRSGRFPEAVEHGWADLPDQSAESAP